MTKADMHYLNCQDDNCEKIACVGRRDYERRILYLETKLEKLIKSNSDCTMCDPNAPERFSGDYDI